MTTHTLEVAKQCVCSDAMRCPFKTLLFSFLGRRQRNTPSSQMRGGWMISCSSRREGKKERKKERERGKKYEMTVLSALKTRFGVNDQDVGDE